MFLLTLHEQFLFFCHVDMSYYNRESWHVISSQKNSICIALLQADADVDRFITEETHTFSEYCNEVKKYQNLYEEILYSSQKVGLGDLALIILITLNLMISKISTFLLYFFLTLPWDGFSFYSSDKSYGLGSWKNVF